METLFSSGKRCSFLDDPDRGRGKRREARGFPGRS